MSYMLSYILSYNGLPYMGCLLSTFSFTPNLQFAPCFALSEAVLAAALLGRSGDVGSPDR